MRIAPRSSTQRRRPRSNRGFILLVLTLLLACVGVNGWFVWSIVKNVPGIDAVTDYKPKIPLRIYTADQVLIGEFGVERRDFVPIAQMPVLMKKAVLAIEDARWARPRQTSRAASAKAPRPSRCRSRAPSL